MLLLQCYSVCGMKKATCESRLEKCMKTKCAAMASASDREKCDSTVKLFQLGTQVGQTALPLALQLIGGG